MINKLPVNMMRPRCGPLPRAFLMICRALEIMIGEGLVEEGVRRIGAEQEVFLVDSSLHPAPIVTEVMNEARDGRLTTEIGRFNLEANLTPRAFKGSSLRDMETELNEILDVVRSAAVNSAPASYSPASSLPYRCPT